MSLNSDQKLDILIVLLTIGYWSLLFQLYTN